jgi:hypothetical protein
MWQAWDLAAEMCLLQLPGLLADPNAEFVPSSFFSEQLTAFELWLAHGSADKKPPEQLPIVLQVRALRGFEWPGLKLSTFAAAVTASAVLSVLLWCPWL